MGGGLSMKFEEFECQSVQVAKLNWWWIVEWALASFGSGVMDSIGVFVLWVSMCVCGAILTLLGTGDILFLIPNSCLKYRNASKIDLTFIETRLTRHLWCLRVSCGDITPKIL